MKDVASEARAPASLARPAPRFASPPHLPGLPLLLFALALLHSALYAAVVPPWQMPDEPKHFEYVALLYALHRPLAREDASPALQARLVASMAENDFWRYGFGERPTGDALPFAEIWPSGPTALDRPPLYYYLALPVYALVAPENILLQLYALRLFSAFLGALTVLVAYLLAREVFPHDRFLTLGAPGFVALLPMFAFVSGSLNSDNLANLLAAVVIYLLVRGLRSGLGALAALGLVGLLAAGFWTKRTTLFALPLALAALPLYLGGGRLRLGRGALAATAGLLALGSLALQLPGVQTGVRWALDRYVFDYSAAANLALFQGRDYRLEMLASLYGSFFWTLHESFWGRFGWMNLPLSPAWYQATLVLSGGAALGLAVLLWRLDRRPGYLSRQQGGELLLCGLAVALVVAVAVIQHTAEFNPRLAPQGRYLFPALPALALLYLLGLRELAPRRWRGFLLAVLVAGLLFLAQASLLAYVIPAYYR